LFHLLAVTILVAGVLLAQAAAAEDRRTLLRDACLADYQQLCSSVTPGGGRIKQCMLEHSAGLSNECRSALLAAQSRQ
jgi:hypothetical protein